MSDTKDRVNVAGVASRVRLMEYDMRVVSKQQG